MLKQKLLRKIVLSHLSRAVFLICALLFFQTHIHAQELPGISKYIKNGGYALQKNRTTVYSKSLRTPFIPASTIKLVTSLAALKILGPDHYFQTDLYLDSAHNLYIKGGGDPFLVSEKIRLICELITEKDIHHIILDDSAFALEHVLTEGSENSSNPYDVRNTALGVNFNTVPLKVYHRAKVQSPESQTPYLSIMGRIGEKLDSGYHRVNVDSFPQHSSLSNSLLYSGQLFKALLEEQGVQVRGEIKQGVVPQGTPLLLRYTSDETISSLVESCLFSSNNFMANQLYLAIGAKKYGFPATWKKSQMAMNHFTRNFLGLTTQQISMVEGSGLSKKNRITAEAMLVVLEQLKPYTSLIPIKYGVRMKSGTLRKSGVFCYAGFITKGTSVRPFSILLNQTKNNRDKILKILYRQ